MQQPCPDPSAHHSQHKLSEQASTAALYVTHPERGHDPRENILNQDGKLSSKSAATSLRYARPQDLPSFPSHGIDTANSAGHAAMLAKDYKMKELWQPDLSAAGSRAALIAHKDGGKLDLWQPSASADGNSAAKLAMQNKTLSPKIDYGYTKDGRSNALLAATMSQRAGRQRSGSTPIPRAAAYPDSANSAYNALNAATISHRASTKQQTQHNPRDPDGWGSVAMQAARIGNIGDHLDREMFTERPPVEIEKQEQRDKAALRASAISMAKQMYDVQNRTTLGDASTPALDGKQFATHVTSSQPVDIKQEALKYIHLQDAAHKLAQERLAKVDKTFEAQRYREYYGYGNSPRSRLSTRSFTRKRASSDTAKDDWDSDDEERAQRVRSQMTQFSSALASVDAKKQQADRDQLLAIAQKRVQKSMHDMDEKVFQDTGKVSQAMMDEWETKARKRAAEEAEHREATRGKTHIGAGKYMDTSEIEAIAQARLKPTLDEINDNAEKRRARDEEIRLDRVEQERTKQIEKQREKEHKDIQRRAKQEQKAAAKEEKAIAKREKEDRAAESGEPSNRRSIFGLLSLKHKDHDAKKESPSLTAGDNTTEQANVDTTPAAVIDVAENRSSDELSDSSVDDARDMAVTQGDAAKTDDAAISKESKQSKGVKGLFAKLRHRQSKSDPKDAELSKGVAATTTDRSDPDSTAVVGASIVADEQSHEDETVTVPVVAASVTEPPNLPDQTAADSTVASSAALPNVAPVSPSSFKRRDADDNDADISSLSSSGLEEEHLTKGRTGRVARSLGLGKLKAKLLPSKKAGEDEPGAASQTQEHDKDASGIASKTADAKEIDKDDDDDDTFEEARDTVDAALAPEPAPSTRKVSSQSGRETKFQEEL